MGQRGLFNDSGLEQHAHLVRMIGASHGIQQGRAEVRPADQAARRLSTPQTGSPMSPLP
jgi:hypothetical protein